MTRFTVVRRALVPVAAGLIACALLAGPIVAQQAPPAAPAPKPGATAAPAAPKSEAPMKKDVAVIKTNMGTIVFEFLPDVAPKMVENFKDLAKSGFYDGTTFHRVIQGFMIQGGDPLSKDDDPTNDGTGSGPRKMQAEFTRKYGHKRGIVSTARGGHDVNSGSCQFFIMHRDNPGLDGQYTIFGRVLEGMDTVDKIAVVQTSKPGDRPIKNVVMEKVSIETR